MLSIIYWTIWALNVLCLLLRKNPRALYLASVITLFIVFAANTMNGDFAIYYREYSSGNTTYFQIGFNALMWACGAIGLSYNQFLLLTAIIVYGLVFYVMTRLTSNRTTFFVLYLPILLFYDMNQLRNFFVVGFLTFSLFLLYRQKRAFAGAMLLAASLVHPIALFYLPLCFIDFKSKNINTAALLLGVFVALLCVATFVNGNHIPFFEDIVKGLSVTVKEGSAVYFDRVTHFGFLINWTLYFMNIGLVLLSKRALVKLGVYDRYADYYSVIWAANIWGCLALPLVMVNHNFYRIFRNLCVSNIILAAVVFEAYGENLAVRCKDGRTNNERASSGFIVFALFLAVYCIAWVAGIVIQYGGTPQSIIILSNNFLIPSEFPIFE